MSGASGLRKHGHASAGDGGTLSGIAASGPVTTSGLIQATGKLLGRTTASTGAIEEITVGSGLSLSAGSITATGGGGVEIDDDAALIQGVNFEDQGSDPTSPAASHHIVYAKAGGIYVKDSAATVVGPLSTGGGTFATPSIALASSAAAGSASTVIRSDSTIAAFDATSPTTQALGDSAAVGTAAFAARRDHKHAMPAAAITSSGLTQATGKLLGRSTAATGAIEEITIGTNLSLSGGTLDASGTGGSVGTDVIWDAAGDLAVGTGSNTAAKLTLGASSTVPTSNGSTLAYAYPPGYEFDYAEITSNVSITATAEGSATTVVTGNAVTYDGSTAVVIEFYSAEITIPGDASGNFVGIVLYDGSSSIGILEVLLLGTASASFRAGGLFRRRLTPSAAAHTYSVRAYASTSSGGQVSAGAGGSGNRQPAYIRITKV